MYTPEQEAAWRRIARLRARLSRTPKIGLQLGHSGRKGSTRLMWEGMDEPLPDGNWAVCAPSPLPYQRRREPGAARADASPRCGRSCGSSWRPRRPADACRVRPARAALRARLPAVVLHLAGLQPAHRRVRRLAGRPAALSAGGVRRDARGVAGAQADDRAHLRDRLGARAASPAPTPSRSRRRSRGGRGRHRRLDRSGHARTSSRPSAGRTRRRSRTRSATRSASPPSPSA